MKLWLLKKTYPRPANDDPWKPWYDTASGFVVRAATEQEARAFAQSDAGDEAHNLRGVDPWINPEYTTCEELTADGEAGVVLQDFHAA